MSQDHPPANAATQNCVLPPRTGTPAGLARIQPVLPRSSPSNRQGKGSQLLQLAPSRRRRDRACSRRRQRGALATGDPGGSVGMLPSGVKVFLASHPADFRDYAAMGALLGFSTSIVT